MCKIQLNKKSASVTVEFAYGIFAALVVLFIALGIFCSNLSQLAENTGMKNMFNNSNSEAKTATSSYGNANNTSTFVVAPSGSSSSSSSDGLTCVQDGGSNGEYCFYEEKEQ